MKKNRIKHFFKEIHRAFRLQRMFAALHLKKLMEYKVDFAIGAVGFLVEQVVNIAFLSIIFGRVESLRGWNYYEVLFIYGFSLFPNGLDHLLFDNIWNVGYWMIRKGDFDKYLTRPINTLLIVTVEEFQIDAFGKLLLGVALMVFLYQDDFRRDCLLDQAQRTSDGSDIQSESVLTVPGQHLQPCGARRGDIRHPLCPHILLSRKLPASAHASGFQHSGSDCRGGYSHVDCPFRLAQGTRRLRKRGKLRHGANGSRKNNKLIERSLYGYMGIVV